MRSSISSGRTRIRTSRPAWTANERSTPAKLSAMPWRSSSRLTYVSIVSPRAPGRDALIASATWTIGASMQANSTSWWWAAMPFTTFIGMLCFCAIDGADGGVRPLDLVVDRLADVVQQAADLGGLDVGAELRRHDRREVARLDAVDEHVLAVARAVLEPAEQLDELGREARARRPRRPPARRPGG